MTFLKEFGLRLKQERHRIRHTIDEMAAGCGLTSEAYIAYEDGTQDMPANVLAKLADHSVDLRYLFGGTSPQKAADFSALLSKQIMHLVNVQAFGSWPAWSDDLVSRTSLHTAFLTVVQLRKGLDDALSCAEDSIRTQIHIQKSEVIPGIKQ